MAGYRWDQAPVWLPELVTCMCGVREGHLCCGRLVLDSGALGSGGKWVLCLHHWHS